MAAGSIAVFPATPRSPRRLGYYLSPEARRVIHQESPDTHEAWPGALADPRRNGAGDREAAPDVAEAETPRGGLRLKRPTASASQVIEGVRPLSEAEYWLFRDLLRAETGIVLSPT